MARIPARPGTKGTIMTLSTLRPSTIRTYNFINDFIQERGYSPSTNEIKEGVPLSSKSVSVYHRDQLIRAGLLTYEPGRRRSIELAGSFTLNFHNEDARYMREKFGDVTASELVRLLRNEEAVASGSH